MRPWAVDTVCNTILNLCVGAHCKMWDAALVPKAIKLFHVDLTSNSLINFRSKCGCSELLPWCHYTKDLTCGLFLHSKLLCNQIQKPSTSKKY